jgi:hypothetical protein
VVLLSQKGLYHGEHRDSQGEIFTGEDLRDEYVTVGAVAVNGPKPYNNETPCLHIQTTSQA